MKIVITCEQYDRGFADNHVVETHGALQGLVMSFVYNCLEYSVPFACADSADNGASQQRDACDDEYGDGYEHTRASLLADEV